MEGLPSVIPKSIVEVLNRLENDEDNLFLYTITVSHEKPGRYIILWKPQAKFQDKMLGELRTHTHVLRLTTPELRPSP